MPALVAALDHDSDEVQYELVTAITARSELAMPHLENSLQNESSRIRAGAAYALGHYRLNRNQRAAANMLLVTTLDDANAEVRLRAAESLVGSEAAQAAASIPVLVETLRDELPMRRQRAAATLGALGPSAEVAALALLEVLKDKVIEVRLEAAVAVAKIDTSHTAAILPILEQVILLDCPSPYWLQNKALEAARGLGEFAQPLGDAIARRLGEPFQPATFILRLELAKTLVSIDAEKLQLGVNELVDLLPERETNSWNLRIDAIRALGRIGSRAKSAVPALIGLTKDKRPRIAAFAAVTAIQIDPMVSDEAWAFLRESLTVDHPADQLQDEQEQRLRACIRVLDTQKDMALVFLPELIALINDPTGDYLSEVIYLLEELGPAAGSAIPALKKLLTDDRRYIRRDAQAAIDGITAKPADAPDSPESKQQTQATNSP